MKYKCPVCGDFTSDGHTHTMSAVFLAVMDGKITVLQAENERLEDYYEDQLIRMRADLTQSLRELAQARAALEGGGKVKKLLDRLRALKAALEEIENEGCTDRGCDHFSKPSVHSLQCPVGIVARLRTVWNGTAEEK